MAKRRFLACVAVLAALSGCAAKQGSIVDVEAEGMANPEVALRRSMDRVARAKADMRSSRGGQAVVPAELQRPIAWKWTGPLDQAAKALATQVGYAYAEPGPDAPSMPTVTVDVNGVAVVDVLRSLGTQAGTKATLVVDTETRVIQVARHVS